MRFQPDGEGLAVVDLGDHLIADHVDHCSARCQMLRLDAAGDGLAGEVQHGDLYLSGVEPVDHDEHGLVGHLRHLHLHAGGDAVARADRQNLAQP
jgi:hypothetical protein